MINIKGKNVASIVMAIVLLASNISVSYATTIHPQTAPAGEMTIRANGAFNPTYDWGDAPTAAQSGFASSYPTTAADNGANHVIDATLYMGRCVDDDANGQPTVGAYGDDNNNTTAGCTDDEDGVHFNLQLLPGEEAFVTVGSTHPLSTDATLNAWIDWNQDGDWDDAGEQIAQDVTILGSTVVTNANTKTVSIDVPLTAIRGNTYARFRLDYGGGLTPTGAASEGEVEDYLVEVIDVATLGDYVWHDLNNNGNQDAEPPVEGVLVNLYRASDDALIGSQITDVNGNYLFTSLLPDTYYVEFVPPANYTFTTQDGAGDAVDSDADPATGLTIDITLAAGDDDRTWDAGLVLPDNTLTFCEAIPFETTEVAHTFMLDKFDPALGTLTAVDIQSYGAMKTWLGTENRASTPSFALFTAGLNGFLTLPDTSTLITSQSLGTGFKSYAAYDGVTDFRGPSAFAFTEWQYDTDAVSQNYTPVADFIAGAPGEQVDLPFLTWTSTTIAGGGGNIAFSQQTRASAGVCVSYTYTYEPVSIGSIIWDDANNDGIQTDGENGIAGATVTLLDGTGTTALFTQTTGADGLYYFDNLPPGDYQVQVEIPAGYEPTIDQQTGDDDDSVNDSNIATSVGNTHTSGTFTITMDGEPNGESSNIANSDDADNSDDDNGNMTVDFGFVGQIFDPPFGSKVVNADSLPELEWTMIWINDGNETALNAAVSDPISTGTQYIAGSVVCTAMGSSTTTVCDYESPSATYPLGRIIWEGDIGPDLGATDADSADNEIAITFRVTVDEGIQSVDNEASLSADLNNDGDLEDEGEEDVAQADASWSASDDPPSSLPATGFRHGRVTALPNQPAAKAYTETAMMLEIPKFGVSMPIVGVPQSESGWDVTWLNNSAGYLAGSAFPTWSGNTVITGHVWDAWNQPGAFSALKTLKYGDQVQIKARGLTYTYEVRESKLVTKKNVSAAFQSEDYDWVTLVTCEFYNPFTGDYLFRRSVRAVLISVK